MEQLICNMIFKQSYDKTYCNKFKLSLIKNSHLNLFPSSQGLIYCNKLTGRDGVNTLLLYDVRSAGGSEKDG